MLRAKFLGANLHHLADIPERKVFFEQAAYANQLYEIQK
jgi:hypothetical protein